MALGGGGNDCDAGKPVDKGGGELEPFAVFSVIDELLRELDECTSGRLVGVDSVSVESIVT